MALSDRNRNLRSRLRVNEVNSPLQSPERSLCSLAGQKPGRYCSGDRDEPACGRQARRYEDEERFIAHKVFAFPDAFGLT
jgi:hypothetical protein